MGCVFLFSLFTHPSILFLQARSIWYSPQQDIAFLKVDPAAVPWPDAEVRLASWTSFPADDVTSASEFSPVVAIGNPARFPFTAMQGAYIGPSYRTNEAIGGTREVSLWERGGEEVGRRGRQKEKVTH